MTPPAETSQDPDEPKEPNAPTDDELLDRVAEGIASRRLSVPAIVFLESSKPLSFLGSQFLVFMEPFVKSFFTVRLYDRFVALMEDRDNIETLLRKIERIEADRKRKGNRKAEGNDGTEQEDRSE